jgi:hypothetical protein
LSASTARPKLSSNFCCESTTSDSGDPGGGGVVDDDDDCCTVVPSDGGVIFLSVDGVGAVGDAAFRTSVCPNPVVSVPAR